MLTKLEKKIKTTAFSEQIKKKRSLNSLSQVRSLTCGFGVMSAYLGMFASIQAFPFLQASLGLPNTLYAHVGVCAAVWAVAFVFLPETRGKTEDQMATLFHGKKDNKGEERA